jgi:flagellum-specific peptidoglycan hydrolase FlgJ
MSVAPRADFIRRALEAADRAKAEGAPIVPGIVAAQAALESRYGESQLAKEANNLFGIKAGKSWQGPVLKLPTTEFLDGKLVPAIANWRIYASWAECLTDYGNIIQLKPWFADAAVAGAVGDAATFLDEMAAHWATDPNYALKVWAIAKRWALVT